LVTACGLLVGIAILSILSPSLFSRLDALLIRMICYLLPGFHGFGVSRVVLPMSGSTS
jgi:hypothetical protein